jgi:beta propeller repeat protein
MFDDPYSQLSIFEDYVIWLDLWHWNPLQGDVQLLDMWKQRTTRITSSPARFPDIYGDFMVYLDYSQWKDDVWKLCLVDLSTGKEHAISESNSIKNCKPEIYENRVVWVDTRHGNSDIYVSEFVYVPAFKVPELPLGTLTAVVSMGFAFFARRKRI